MIRSRNPMFIFAGLLPIALIAALAGCGGDSGNSNGNTAYGASKTLGNGTIRTYIMHNGNSVQQVGVEFTPGVLTGLPNIQQGDATEVPLPVPPEFALTPFKAAQMDWSPGHPPDGNQNTPHFHPTFFLISDADRALIKDGGAGATVPIDPLEIPGAHIPAGLTIPDEGFVLFDPNLASYNEAPFQSTTYQYDFWNGHMVNIQLGVANVFVAKKTSQGDILIQPQKYPVTGVFPTHYELQFDTNRQVYRMYLDNFKQVTAAGPANNDAGQATVYGDAEPVGSGTARSFVSRDANNKPLAVGVAFTTGVLNGLPNIAMERAQDFPLPNPGPNSLNQTPFQSISMQWTPGHIPNGRPNSQEVPHFQANFFLVSRAVRNTIFPPPLGNTMFVQPAAAEIPAGTLGFGNVVPFEGSPFIDPRNPQWSEEPAFQTVGYNFDFFQGHLDNIQLGVTNAFLPSQKEVTGAIAQPQKYPTTGYFPTQYHIKWDAANQQYLFYVENFVQHLAQQ